MWKGVGRTAEGGVGAQTKTRIREAVVVWFQPCHGVTSGGKGVKNSGLEVEEWRQRERERGSR